MNPSLYADIQLAEGFRFTDTLSAPYRLAYGHIKSPCSAVVLSNVDGSERRELFPEDDTRRGLMVCFCPDGITMYYHDQYTYAQDLTTGQVRRIEGIPQAPPFDEMRSLECSPDNRFLVFTQTAVPRMVRGSAPLSRQRLCRVNTEGADFRVLYEDTEDKPLLQTVICWQQGFALLHCGKYAHPKSRNELWKVNLEDGRSEFLARSPHIGWSLAVRPDGRQAAWASHDEKLYLCSLDNGLSRKLLSVGTQPAWSPDGKTLAFMKDQHCLSLLDLESERTQDLVWFEPPNLSAQQRQGSYAVEPVWSPDGKMLWFTLTQARTLPPPQNLLEALREGAYFLYPLLHNLNPRRTSYFAAHERHYHRMRTGLIDLSLKRVMISHNYLYGVFWLPLCV